MKAIMIAQSCTIIAAKLRLNFWRGQSCNRALPRRLWLHAVAIKQHWFRNTPTISDCILDGLPRAGYKPNGCVSASAPSVSCGEIMARLLPQCPPEEIAAPDDPASGDQAECLDNMMRKIGFVAACIDLHSWRTIIDEVLEEVESANERAALLETTLQGSLPPPPSLSSIQAPLFR
jgi:hypothetical protein